MQRLEVEEEVLQRMLDQLNANDTSLRDDEDHVEEPEDNGRRKGLRGKEKKKKKKQKK